MTEFGSMKMACPYRMMYAKARTIIKHPAKPVETARRTVFGGNLRRDGLVELNGVSCDIGLREII